MPDRRLIPVGVFTLAYLLGAVAFALRRWNPEFLFYAAVMALEIGAVVWLHRRARLPLWLLWALSVWGLIHMLGGTVPIPSSVAEPGVPPVLYNFRPHPSMPKFDQAAHAYGFFVATCAAWHALRAAAPALRPTTGVLIGVALTGMGLGAINEVIEFAATRLLSETNVGGYVNTGWDLVSNLVGCVAAAVSVRLAHSPGAAGP